MSDKIEKASRPEQAVEKFLKGFNCSQAVFSTYGPLYGIDEQQALKIATGFGAGMARMEEVCGAVTGGILAIGLKHGRGEGQEKTVTDETYRKVRELMSRFESKHGSCICRVLLDGCDLSTPDGQRQFKENDLMNKVCKGCVATAVEAVESLI